MKFERIPDRNVSLKYLQITSSNECLTKVKAYLTIIDFNYKIYGISQNPDTRNYIMVFKNGYCVKCGEKYTKEKYKWCKSCQINCLKNNFTNWTSENKKIDDFIQEVQLQINDYNDVIFEWVPYNQFENIKKIGKGNFTITVFSAIWKSGPLNYNYSKMKLKKIPNRNVSLKHLHNTNINEFLTKVKTYLTNTDNCKMYGISQHPDTKNFIIVLQDKYYIEYNKNYCERCNDIYTNIKYKWCSPCQTNNLKLNFSGNKIINDLILEMQLKINSPFDRVFEWIPCNQFNDIKEIGKDDYDIVYSAIWKDGPLYYNGKKWTRKSNTKVALKCLYNLQNNINEFLNKVRIHSTSTQIYGLSQNSSTDDFIIIFESKYCEEYKIDNLQDMIFEWIPYNQFYKIKNMGSTSGDNTATIYSAIWKNGPLYYNHSKNEYIRKLNKKITLKCLHNSRSTINEFINKVNSFLTNKDNIIFKTYGISQNPDTGNYIIVLQDKYYKEYGKSYCKQCIGKYTDIENKWCKPCQINYLKNNFIYWTSKNRKIDDFIQEIQLKINDWDDIIFEWIPYNQFNDINEICKSSYFTVYSAIWKDGPLCYDNNKMELKRASEKMVTLKCLHYNIYNLQNIINKFLNKVNAYAGNSKIYGMSQNPITKDYIMILQEKYCTEYGTIYCEECDEKYTNAKYKWCKLCQINNFKKNFMDWTNGNEQINDCVQKMQLKINSWNDTVFEWIPYSKFKDVKEIGKNSYSSVYSAIWKGGPLYYDHNSKKWIRKADENVVLKCLITNEFLNMDKAYSTDNDKMLFKVYGISQNPQTKDYIIVLHYNRITEIYERYVTNLFYNLPTNEKIIDFIHNVVFEWISYNQFDEIEEICKDGFDIVNSAIWEDGLLYFDDNKKKWTRKSNIEVTLKYISKF
ncbi:uncharacterized protein OCT59_019248 [Rhizophagus irregularis]|uniref:uncharacterized protein n=1 Tax=Rhizophagus irregularis TaxID=588596 RepID=UPI003329D726|nr:hypothetical protein OCT59_019248 [Rhizophagus irregularis]